MGGGGGGAGTPMGKVPGPSSGLGEVLEWEVEEVLVALWMG